MTFNFEHFKEHKCLAAYLLWQPIDERHVPYFRSGNVLSPASFVVPFILFDNSFQVYFVVKATCPLWKFSFQIVVWKNISRKMHTSSLKIMLVLTEFSVKAKTNNEFFWIEYQMMGIEKAPSSPEIVLLHRAHFYSVRATYSTKLSDERNKIYQENLFFFHRWEVNVVRVSYEEKPFKIMTHFLH